MGSNADTMRDAYDAFGRGDMDAVMATWTDDIRWDGSNNEELPGGGRHEGKQAVAQTPGRPSRSTPTSSTRATTR